MWWSQVFFVFFVPFVILGVCDGVGVGSCRCCEGGHCYGAVFCEFGACGWGCSGDSLVVLSSVVAVSLARRVRLVAGNDGVGRDAGMVWWVRSSQGVVVLVKCGFYTWLARQGVWDRGSISALEHSSW